ncbi:RNA-directed DNA polymerase from mobile element jockey [Labeo rohita]|uniref:RNA-directed DNA polymerase from mobile element jockey n=1 Tax=Labeo rohita TaxID=84645 RepID=A0ABQ8LFX0_LABRO|nr:RNA-directed DNA polymerase from mobile element jockey [Labeo rohita]
MQLPVARIVYTRDQLFNLRPATASNNTPREIPPECWRKTHRGCRGNKKLRRKREALKQRRLMMRKFKPFLPSIIMGNVRSLANKMDELTALSQSQREYRECSVMCFTETWLHQDIPDDYATVTGFHMVRADRDCVGSGKRKGGGLAVLVNNRWCNPAHITVKECICNPDVELCAVGLRPYYLPREFSHVVMVIVYAPPSANPSIVCDTIHSVIARIQTQHPSAFIAISGDFNHIILDKTLPTFTQFVNCPTREGRIIDLLYANVRDAYSSSPLPPLGRSDHNLIHLTPCYVPLVKRLPATSKIVRRWTEEANETLQGCFEVTDWQALCEPHGQDIDGITECITGYINFCVDTIVPVRTVNCYPNNKPWVTKDIKAILNRKKKAFRDGNKVEVRAIQRDLRIKIREAKEKYRRKLEWKLQQNNMREVWSGMRTITGYKSSGSGGVNGGVEQANELNQFFNRFDIVTPIHPANDSSAAERQRPAASPVLSSPTDYLDGPACTSSSDPSADSHHLEITGSPPPPITFTTEQVRRQLQKIHIGKSAGPDGVSPRVLKDCALQLSGVLHYVFNLSLSLQRVPVMWKTSCLVPVPKMPRSSDLKDYRPVALTSHIMKTLERLILEQLRPMVQPFLDPLQFAYQPRLGVEDAVIFLLNRVYTHLDKPASTKLMAMQVDAPLVSWMVDYLTGRPQYVRLQSCMSDRLISNTGAPQGTVLSPFLFTLYTTDFDYRTETCHLQKFSDDSAVVGCITGGDEREYRAVVDNFVTWSESNHLLLNVTKTKELVVDLRRTKAPVTPTSIKGVNVEVVEEYKYLGVYLDHKLDWCKNVDTVYRKGQSRLYFLRQLRSFNICRTMLRMFYESVVASAIMYAVVCWGSSLRVRDINRLNRIIRKAGHVVGEELDSLTEVSERRMLSKIKTILDFPSHPLHTVLTSYRSTFSNRLRLPRCTTERHRKSFLPVSIKLLNSEL